MFNIEYEKEIDFGHVEDIHEAGQKLSALTNLLNRIIMARQKAKKEIIVACAWHSGEQMHKLSWDNKMIRLAELEPHNEAIIEWQDADTAYRVVKNKKDQVLEDIMALKKIIDVTPH